MPARACATRPGGSPQASVTPLRWPNSSFSISKSRFGAAGLTGTNGRLRRLPGQWIARHPSLAHAGFTLQRRGDVAVGTLGHKRRHFEEESQISRSWQSASFGGHVQPRRLRKPEHLSLLKV